MSVGVTWNLAMAAQARTTRALAPFDETIEGNVREMIERGREIFRFDTFGSELFWGDRLKLHQAIAGARFGGVGPGLSPAMALTLGLKVDIDMLTPALYQALAAGAVDQPVVERSALWRTSLLTGWAQVRCAGHNIR